MKGYFHCGEVEHKIKTCWQKSLDPASGRPVCMTSRTGGDAGQTFSVVGQGSPSSQTNTNSTLRSNVEIFESQPCVDTI